MGTDGRRLIFLISQPRSGSTLLQHMLGSHPEVHTLPEPWLMLHLVYGMRRTGLEAEYRAGAAYIALQEFLERLPDGEQAYVDGIRRMASYLYRRALACTGKTYFLDKTPRYYLIIPELARLFPEAKFIFLIRNPLAVLSSIIEVNFNGNWRGLFLTDRKHDLFSAPRLILEGVEQLGERVAVVHYESLVADPDFTVRALCQYLGLHFEGGMIEYGSRVHFSGSRLVDPKAIYQHQHPVTDYVDRWQVQLDTDQKLYFARRYLEELGPRALEDLGYSFDELMQAVSSRRQRSVRFLVPWRLLLRPWNDLHWCDRLWVLVMSSLEARGLWATLQAAGRRILR